jgi:hypothetical protein
VLGLVWVRGTGAWWMNMGREVNLGWGQEAAWAW